ncbi:MAG: DUF4276 family protein [Fibrobacteria bacterium]|nr:DUF4276 family protein [Fibrobacteria bacterium]
MSRTLVVFVEETSAKTLLETILPKILPPEVGHRIVPFEGKSDLEKQLIGKIRGWKTPNSRFLVLRDQDSGDCRKVKEHLLELCRQAGCTDALVRIACHELEAWYLGDLSAVERGLDIRGISGQSAAAKFRDPDRLNNAAQELKLLTRGTYQKVGGSRRIAPYLDLSGQNRSVSFRMFCDGIRRLGGIP